MTGTSEALWMLSPNGPLRVRPAPRPTGEGLHRIPEALAGLRSGESAATLVVTLEPRP